MKFGLLAYQVTDRPDLTVEYGKEAERLGYDSIWLAEHHGIRHMYPDTLTLMSAIATQTDSIRLGAQVMIPLHHPLDIAERGAIVDRLSNGRLILAVGQGYAPKEFEWFGVDIKDRLPRFTESVELVKRLWEEDLVTFEGTQFQIKDAHVEPRCVQVPRPPVWILGWAEKAVARAARIGDTWSPGASASIDEIEGRVHIYREARRGLGQDDGSLPVMRFVFVAPTEEEALEEGGHWFLNSFRETYLQWPHPVVGSTLSLNSTYEEVSADRFIVGTPESVTAEIRRWQERLGADEMICVMHNLGSDERAVRQSMELFANEVMPAFR